MSSYRNHATTTRSLSFRGRTSRRRKASSNRQLLIEVLCKREVLTTEFYYRETSFEEYTAAQWSIPAGSHIQIAAPTEKSPSFFDVGAWNNIGLSTNGPAVTGKNALRLEYFANEDRGQAITHIEPGLTEIHTQTKMLFAPGYDVGVGEKILRVFSYNETENLVQFDFIASLFGKPNPGKPKGDLSGISDSYLIAFGTNGSYFGPEYESSDFVPFELERNRWYTINVDMKLNTPGKADGYAWLSVDGKKVISLDGIRIRKDPEDLINRVLVGGWYSNGGLGNPPSAWAPAAPTVRYIDDYIISERPLNQTPVPSQLVNIEAIPVDAQGNKLSTIKVGENFYVQVSAEDLRTAAQGVYSAFVDFTFDAGLASTIGPVEFGSAFPNFQNVDSSTRGLLNELGAAGRDSGVFPAKSELVRIPMRATGAGSFVYALRPADDLPAHETTLVGLNEPVQPSQIRFSVAPLTIVDVNPFHNAGQPWDVNGDTKLSPIDALLIANFLRTNPPNTSITAIGSSWNGRFLDTNNDRLVSHLDLLLVINASRRVASVANTKVEGSALNAQSVDASMSNFFDDFPATKRRTEIQGTKK